MKYRSFIASAAVAAALGLGQIATADSFFVNGWPVENPSSSLASSAISVETGALSTPSADYALEARFRTWLEAILGTKFSSYKALGTFIMLR